MKSLLLSFLIALTALSHDAMPAVSQETYNCYANSSLTASCKVIYTSSLILHCPNATNASLASWWKTTKERHSLCQSKDCEIKGTLHNEDSGLYYCNVDSVGKYYVNVTVLAPPSIDCNPNLCQCNEQTRQCNLPYLFRYSNDDVDLSVQYSGVGPFTVKWVHHGGVMNCSDTSFDAIDCTVTQGRMSDNKYYENLTLVAPILNVTLASGVYEANVSNPYGYNMTWQLVKISELCKIINPPKSTADHNITLYEGDSGNISLTSYGYQDVNLWLCYTTDPTATIKTIDLNSSCVECLELYRDCGSLPNRPHWNVTRNQSGCFGNAKLTLTAHLVNIGKKDRGRFLMTWSSDTTDTGPQKHGVLTITSLNVTSKPTNGGGGWSSRYLYMSVSGGAVGVVLLVVVVAVVVASVVIQRRRKRDRPLRRRRRQFVGVRGGMVAPGGGTATSGSGDTSSDSDHEQLIRHGSGACGTDYGSVANEERINGITSEIETDVVLPSQTDDAVSV